MLVWPLPAGDELLAPALPVGPLRASEAGALLRFKGKFGLLWRRWISRPICARS